MASDIEYWRSLKRGHDIQELSDFMPNVVDMLISPQPCSACPGRIFGEVTKLKETPKPCVFCRDMVGLPHLYAEAEHRVKSEALNVGNNTPCPCYILGEEEAITRAIMKCESYYDQQWFEIQKEAKEKKHGRVSKETPF